MNCQLFFASTSCSVKYHLRVCCRIYSCTRENVFMMCLPHLFFVMPPRFIQIIKHPICSLRARKTNLQFVHLSALIFCSTMNVTSLFVAFSLFLFLAVTPHKSLLPLIILLSSSLSFSLLLLPSLLFLSVFLRHSGISPSTLLYLSRPPPLPFRLSFFLLGAQCFPF